MDTELRCPRTNATNGAAYAPHETVNAGNGSAVANGHPDAAEDDGLLLVQVASSNGRSAACAHAAAAADAQRTPRNNPAHKVSAVDRIKQELNEVVCLRAKLWMILILLFLAIIAVIFISLALCSVIHVDEDDQFDPSSFIVPRLFNGSFQMPNMVFTEELFTLSSNESQTLAAELQDKLDDLYRSSTALGRYFSKADVYAFRNGSAVVDYELTFLLPEAEQEPLRRFVVSREVVYNVFRQFLYDQEADESAAAYIDPASLTMLPGGS